MTTPSNVCQCCLDGVGEFRNMMDEYLCNGIPEVYCSMIFKCFSIEIPMSRSEFSDFLICISCVDKLRETLMFKQQIEESQKALKSWHMTSTENGIIEENIIFENLDKNTLDHVNYYQVLSSEDLDDCKERYISSEDILDRAIARTQRNLQLLRNSHPNGIENILGDNETNNKLGSDSEEEPEDKKERIKYLYRKRYARNLPYKLKKTDRICKFCNESFPSYKPLLLHMQEHFPNYICNHCGKVFVQRRQLIRHINFTHSSDRVACSTCNAFIKKASLKRHMSAHTGNNYYHKCHFCSEKFTNYTSQINHMVKSHNYKGNEYKCNICLKVFKFSSDLSDHVKCVHLREKKHSCSECKMQFFSKHKVKMHMLTHTQEKNFECGVCHKKYGRRSTLTEHLKIHNNIKNHTCSVCKTAFTQKSTLQKHLNVCNPSSIVLPSLLTNP